MAVQHRDQGGAGCQGGEDFFDVRLRAAFARPPRPLRRQPARVQPVGRGDGEQPGPLGFLGQDAERLDHLGRHRTLVGERDARALRRGDDPMRARDHRSGVEHAVRLRQRARGQAQPHRRAIGFLHVRQRVAQQDGEFIDMGGLETREPVGGHADQRCVDRLVLPALGRQGEAGGGGDQQEARVLVTGVDQRIEAAVDEWIVDRADRQDARAGHRGRQPGGAEEEKEVLLGDPQLDMLPQRRHSPPLGRGELGVAEHIVAGMPVEDAAPVHPRAEIGRDGDIRAGGHDVGAEFLQLALAAADLGQDVAEAALGGHFPARGLWHRQCGRHRNDRRGQAASLGREFRGERSGGEEIAELRFRNVETFEQIPFVAGPDAHVHAELFHLFLGHQPGVVVLVAREWQPHALDRVGDETGRLVPQRLGGAEMLHQRFDVVAAEIGHQRAEFFVVALVDDGAGTRAAEIGQQHLAPRGAALEGQRGIEAVGAVVDPAAQILPALAREGGFQSAAELDGDAVPAHVAEQPLDAAEQPVRHHAVEALAVIVDHPPQIADIVLPAFQQGFVDVALVEFGVARDGDVASRRQVGAAEAVQADVIGHQGGEGGHRHAQTDRAGGEIDLGAVLDPAGIGLDAAEPAQPLQVFLRLASQQVVDRVEHRARVGFDGDAVLGAGDFHVERRQDRDAGGAGRLMPADLQPVPVGADVVGVMDHPRRQPEQLALHLFQRADPVFARRAVKDRRGDRRVHGHSAGSTTGRSVWHRRVGANPEARGDGNPCFPPHRPRPMTRAVPSPVQPARPVENAGLAGEQPGEGGAILASTFVEGTRSVWFLVSQVTGNASHARWQPPSHPTLSPSSRDHAALFTRPPAPARACAANATPGTPPASGSAH